MMLSDMACMQLALFVALIKLLVILLVLLPQDQQLFERNEACAARTQYRA